MFNWQSNLIIGPHLNKLETEVNSLNKFAINSTILYQWRTTNVSLALTQTLQSIQYKFWWAKSTFIIAWIGSETFRELFDRCWEAILYSYLYFIFTYGTNRTTRNKPNKHRKTTPTVLICLLFFELTPPSFSLNKHFPSQHKIY